MLCMLLAGCACVHVATDLAAAAGAGPALGVDLFLCLFFFFLPLGPLSSAGPWPELMQTRRTHVGRRMSNSHSSVQLHTLSGLARGYCEQTHARHACIHDSRHCPDHACLLSSVTRQVALALGGCQEVPSRERKCSKDSQLFIYIAMTHDLEVCKLVSYASMISTKRANEKCQGSEEGEPKRLQKEGDLGRRA